jgi:hypothetical protein
MVVVRHFRKSDADDPLYRGLGSIAIAARVRSALFLGRHPDDPEVRAVAQSKCSYAPEGATILFKLEPANGHPKVHWLGIAAELKADDLLMRLPSARGRPDSEREKAKKLLHEFLEDGPMPKSNIARAAAARSISLMTLRRAADELGIVKRREGRQTVWALPEKNAEGK